MAAKKETRTRKVLRVEYADGHVEEVNPNRPRLLIAFETEHGVQQPQTHEQLAWIAWHGLGRPGTFEGWLDEVEALDGDEVEVGKARS